MSVRDVGSRAAESLASTAPSDPDRRPLVLSIAGFDPSSGAGITADLKVFGAHGLYGMACITALTVQSTLGVRAVEAVSTETVAATLRTLAEDVSFAGIKVGMLANGANSRVVNIFLNSLPGVPVVLDPVLRSSSGRDLLDAEGLRVMREGLLGRVDWITPNWDELSVLTGVPVERREDVPEAAQRLRELARALGDDRRNDGKLNIVVTGGELDPPDDYLLTAAGESHWIAGKRVETEATHGTGCAYSSSLLCRLVAGDAPLLAATRAKEYVAAAMRAAYPVGRGKGPMNHLFDLAGAGDQPRF